MFKDVYEELKEGRRGMGKRGYNVQSFLLEENEIRDWHVCAGTLYGNFPQKTCLTWDFYKKEKRKDEVSYLVPLSPSHALVTRRVLLKADLKIVCMANANRVSFVLLPE